MANQLTQDPLFIDTTVTNVPCQRIVGIVCTGQVSITDSETNHIIFTNGTSTDGWYGINVTIPVTNGVQAIDVAVVGGEVMIYLGSGQQ